MLRFLRRLGMVRGVLGGNRAWAAVWALLAVGGLVRRLTSDKPEIVYRTVLRGDDALVISSREPRSLDV